MLRIVTGPFHPDLELALVGEVRALKTADALTPLTIIVPSDSLRRRLTWLLCAEQGCALLDVRFLTFYQFAVRLLQESAAFDPAFHTRQLDPPTPGTPLHPPTPELAKTSSLPVGRAVSPVARAGQDQLLARLRSAFFFRELVHQLLRRDAGPDPSRWAHLADMPGAWAALLATLNDLKDAGVAPEAAGEALSQSQFEGATGIEALMTLYRAFLD